MASGNPGGVDGRFIAGSVQGLLHGFGHTGPDGCNACKLLYVNNQTNDLVYSCEHQGQVFFRTNVSGCLACGSTVAYSVNV